MIDPAPPRARFLGLHAALWFLVPFGGALPVMLAAPQARSAPATASRVAFAYPWPGSLWGS